MVEILKMVNTKYVPTIKIQNELEDEEDIIKERIMFGGDQLTVERAIGAMAAVMDADTPYKQLKGIIPVVEDFHCEMNILQVSQSHLNLFNIQTVQCFAKKRLQPLNYLLPFTFNIGLSSYYFIVINTEGQTATGNNGTTFARH